MAHDIDGAARLLVVERARWRCEYCLVHEDNAGFPHQIDHIISRKHGRRFGRRQSGLCLHPLHRYKGMDIASIDRAGRPVRLFDPRRDSWDEHFKLDGAVIEPLTPVGEVTTRMLRLNAAELVIERRLFQVVGSYRKT